MITQTITIPMMKYGENPGISVINGIINSSQPCLILHQSVSTFIEVDPKSI